MNQHAPQSIAASRRGHAVRLILIGLVALALFWPLVLAPTQVLYTNHSDLLSLHVPRKRFLVRWWNQTRELPKWNPNAFCGEPFIHDIQVAAFYPPHAILLALDESQVAAALSWLVVAHVLLAGCLMYAYAVRDGRSADGAFVAAVGYMLGGKWLLHVVGAGHYILVGLAWLPLVLLLVDAAIRKRSLLRATAAGVVFGLVILGDHPQWTFYAGLFIAAWSLLAALETAGWVDRDNQSSSTTQTSLAAALGTWLACGIWVALVGAALAAVQLLPTYELTQSTTRGVEGITQGAGFYGTVAVVMKLVGPGLTNPQLAPSVQELRGNVALVWLLAAVLAAVVCGRKQRLQWVIVGGLIVFAAGGSDLLQAVPGFNFFRLPARMLTFLSFPLALLAGATTDALSAGKLANVPRAKWRRILAAVLIVSLGLMIFDGGVMRTQHERQLEQFGWLGLLHPYWYLLLVMLPLAWWLVAAAARGRFLCRVWIGLLVVDAAAVSLLLVQVKSAGDIFEPPASVTYLAEHTKHQERVLDRDMPNKPGTPFHTTSPLGPIQPMLFDLGSVRGYNPLQIRQFKQYIQFIEDQDGGPLKVRLGVETFPIKNKSLLDLMGVRYLLQPTETQFHPDGEPDITASDDWQAVYEDPRPKVYIFTGLGLRTVNRSHTVFENQSALPRAFVVRNAAPLVDDGSRLRQLRENDFQNRVLLEAPAGEDLPADVAESQPPEEPAQSANSALIPATVNRYEPDFVAIQLPDETPAGWLVLSDVWFADWTATVDGTPASVYRGNWLFRAVRVPAGAKCVEFRYQPASLALGATLSAAAAGFVLLVLVVSAAWEWRRRSGCSDQNCPKDAPAADSQ